MALEPISRSDNRGLRINEEYFSGAQASCFIGDVWVDDIVSIDYTLQHSRTPIYGYGSQHFDFVPKGNILVTGSFTINFREPNYLWLIMERYKKLNTKAEIRLKDEAANLDIATKVETYTGDRRKRFDDFFNAIDSRSAKGSLVEQAREFNGIPEDNTKENFNHPSMDILIGYGHSLDKDAPGETIKGIQIMGKSKIVNADGRPIQEQYNFIARNLV